MVEKLFLILCLPLSLLAGEFTASVNRNHIGLDESVILTLSLKDTSAKSAPVVSPLNQSFVVSGQQQFSNTLMHNGHITSTFSWKLTLIPKREGELVIPSISIATAEGTLSTQAITIQATKGTSSANPEESNGDGLLLTTTVSNPQPYKQEPFFYTVKLATKRNISNIKIQKIELENGIVEASEEPKVYETTIDGSPVGIVEFSYLITPLKAGTLKIPSTLVQGVMPMRRKPNILSAFDDEDFSPFSMMSGFDLLKPFVQMTEESVVEVLPAVAEVDPWIPAHSLSLEEVWNKQASLQVGEPYTRTFKIIAEGISSSQLPSLSESLSHASSFKVYADKPELLDESKQGILKSSRIEQYTLIPQQSGDFTLPAITVNWWDAKHKRKRVVSIPERTVHVLPAIDHVAYQPHPAIQDEIPMPLQPAQEGIEKNLWFYAFVGLAAILCIAILWVIALQLRIMKLQRTPNKQHNEQAPVLNTIDLDFEPEPQAQAKRKEKKEKLPDLNPT